MMYRARLILPAHYTQSQIASLHVPFEGTAAAHVALRKENHDQSPWALDWYFMEKPHNDNLSQALSESFDLTGVTKPDQFDWTIEKIPDDIDWLEHSYKQFPAFSVGDFYIYGSHHEGEVPNGQIGLNIDAATAFGSGEHGTTEGCLRAMLDLKEQGICPWNVVDMGTGSGILAIGAYKLWKTPVMAVDNDPESINVTRRHLLLNKIKEEPHHITCDVQDGFSGDHVQKKAPFDLIIANILAGPLMEMASDLVKCADENGYIVLSGILQTQAKDVQKIYEGQNLRLLKTYDIGEWSTLVLHNPGS